MIQVQNAAFRFARARLADKDRFLFVHTLFRLARLNRLDTRSPAPENRSDAVLPTHTISSVVLAGWPITLFRRLSEGEEKKVSLAIAINRIALNPAN